MRKPAPPPRRPVLPAIAGALAAALLALAGWQGYLAVAAQPIQRVIYAGELDRLPQADLEALSQAIQAADRPGLAAMRASARRVPWVRDATVRRRFPDAVEITFRAHDALARWSDDELVSTRGEVFRAGDGAGDLPRFRGPEGSAPAMAWTYADIAPVLAPLGSPVAELRLSRRGAWHVVLRSGLTLQLGRGEIATRLERLVAAWPRITEREPAPEYVDLRYPNGFAARRAATVTVIRGNDGK
ncbi:MAG TPA: cell division protein FtsQ/DivIB [Myxococcota bacterium]|nr:cell division protein FtsQ/DivIB [Myxococcota bacterium]